MEKIKSILDRRSVRSFTGEAVSREDVETILRAGMAAPSAMNSQPWCFIAIDDRALMDSLADSLPYAKMLKSAGAAIVVCGDMSRALPGVMKDFWLQDCAAATENILLAVEALGLGAVWTGVVPNPAPMKVVTDMFGLDASIVPFCVIPIGHPAGNTPAKDKFDAAKIHWNKW
ncbi:MAG: nitroreductase family protein [Proteobacteria bacterium]|nr:nitroreductase family protein [Pseudomonadota bacterium]MBQ4360306.1 nitroreductase family protein [Pseudomonadota bacterium]